MFSVDIGPRPPRSSPCRFFCKGLHSPMGTVWGVKADDSFEPHQLKIVRLIVCCVAASPNRRSSRAPSNLFVWPRRQEEPSSVPRPKGRLRTLARKREEAVGNPERQPTPGEPTLPARAIGVGFAFLLAVRQRRLHEWPSGEEDNERSEVNGCNLRSRPRWLRVARKKCPARPLTQEFIVNRTVSVK